MPWPRVDTDTGRQKRSWATPGQVAAVRHADLDQQFCSQTPALGKGTHTCSRSWHRKDHIKTRNQQKVCPQQSSMDGGLSTIIIIAHTP